MSSRKSRTRELALTLAVDLGGGAQRRRRRPSPTSCLRDVCEARSIHRSRVSRCVSTAARAGWASSFDYGGNALAFNPVGARCSSSDMHSNSKSQKLPCPRFDAPPTMSDLAVATVVAAFRGRCRRPTAIRGRGPEPAGVGERIAGPMAASLDLAASVYYDANGSQRLHFVSGLDLSVKGDVLGPYRVGKLGAGVVSGYFGLIPAEWQAALGGPVLNGNCCLSIISRTSYGPAAFAIDPTKLGTTDPLPAVPLVYSRSIPPGLRRAQYLLQRLDQRQRRRVPRARVALFFGKREPDRATALASDPTLPAPARWRSLCHDPMSAGKATMPIPVVCVWAYDRSIWLPSRTASASRGTSSRTRSGALTTCPSWGRPGFSGLPTMPKRAGFSCRWLPTVPTR